MKSEFRILSVAVLLAGSSAANKGEVLHSIPHRISIKAGDETIQRFIKQFKLAEL